MTNKSELLRDCDGEMVVRDGVWQAKKERQKSIAKIECPPYDASFDRFCIIFVQILDRSVGISTRNGDPHHSLSQGDSAAGTKKCRMWSSDVEVDFGVEDDQ
jgi:hypothetical protein